MVSLINEWIEEASFELTRQKSMLLQAENAIKKLESELESLNKLKELAKEI